MKEGAAESKSTGKLGAIFLIVFLDLLGFGLVLPLLPRYAASLNASPLQVGLLGASYSAMQFVFVPVWGRLSDRIGRRPVLLVSVFASSLAMLLLGFAQSLPWLFVARVFGGLATANIATAQAYIADTTTEQGRARGMGLIGMAFGIGFVVGPFFGGILSTISLGTPARVAAALAFINFVWAFRSLPESLRPLEESNDRRPGETWAKRPKQRVRIGVDIGAISRALSLPGVGIVIVLFFVMTVSFANLEQTFALYTFDEFNLDSKQTGYIFGVVGLISAGVQGGLIGRLNRRYGEIRLIRIGSLLQSIGFAGVGWAAGHGLGSVYLSTAVLTCGNALANPSISSLVSKRSPPDAQGATLGTMQSMGSLGRVVGPTMGGFLYGQAHRLPYFAGSGGLFMACLLALSLRKDVHANAPTRIAAKGEG